MECGSLADKLREQNPRHENSVLKYLTQILEGVCFLHLSVFSSYIFHSDIKPANILFTAGHVLVYRGRGALGTTVVDFLKNKNYVSCSYIFSYLKISDFGITVGSQLQTKASATSSHFQRDFH